MFVGRHAELHALGVRLEAALAGKPQVAIVLGPAGIGKSALARAFAERAAAAGFATALGRVVEIGGAPAYWPWIEALEGLAELPVTDAIARLAPGEMRADSGSAQRFAQFDGVRRALLGAAEARPICLMLDDVHLADAPTLLLARFLAHHVDRGRIAIVLLARDAAQEAASPEIAALVAELATAQRTLRLRGLGEDEVAAMGDALGRSLSADEARALVGATAGNPFFVEEVVASGDLTAVPAGVRELVRAQVARLRGANVLRVAAVLGRRVPVALVAAVAQTTEREVIEAAQAIATIDDASIVFTHALVCDALATELSETERLDVHARAADALEALPRGDERVWLATLAHHARLAAPLGRERRTRAIDIERRAAARALRSYAPRGTSRRRSRSTKRAAR